MEDGGGGGEGEGVEGCYYRGVPALRMEGGREGGRERGRSERLHWLRKGRHINDL